MAGVFSLVVGYKWNARSRAWGLLWMVDRVIDSGCRSPSNSHTENTHMFIVYLLSDNTSFQTSSSAWRWLIEFINCPAAAAHCAASYLQVHLESNNTEEMSGYSWNDIMWKHSMCGFPSVCVCVKYTHALFNIRKWFSAQPKMSGGKAPFLSRDDDKEMNHNLLNIWCVCLSVCVCVM